VVPLSQALSFLPERALGQAEADAVRHGRRLQRNQGEAPVVRLTSGGELVAIAEPRGEDLQPVVVFAPA
jgi:tRNA Pseudouridine synthase II, C terminal